MSDDATVLDEPRAVVVTTGTRADRFTAFARERSPELSRIAYLLCGDVHRAADLVQLALERTYRAWNRVGDGDPFAYARRVIATARIDSWRRTRRDVLVDPADLRPAAAPDGTQHLVDRDELVAALRQLPAGQRRVVVLRYLLDRTEKQTAEDLGISVGAVKSGASRGLDRLRQVLGTGHPRAVSATSEALSRDALGNISRKEAK
ncbi:SigE family RNA polymerase sigma factor [Promicromonospora iranensis]|uniref:RNA polymerase sigma-70 factor (Sigma-E family) n=1 Tax=Promicromonospora iranensis TaxID=1105144 RepID=A0ABU2CLF6_9MICO|nr:SigE family RNA polymerase sigma factor [Promicromonospora iranensis]MDR7382170.1 RNA polymerase sigma-70 factor (sigma-E family) [Promicromonospora iranensis]